MKKFLFLMSVAIVASAVWAQTNTVIKAPANKKAAGQEVGITSMRLVFDQTKNKLIYFGNVVITNVQGNLSCERLTIDLPPQSSTNTQVTNAVAETNVIINLLRDGDTNHVTCDKAVYAYSIVNAVTNETITFIGSSNSPAKMRNSKGWMTGEPLIWDNVNKQFSGVNPQTIIQRPSDNGSNSTPLNILK